MSNMVPEFRQFGYLSAFDYQATAQTLQVVVDRAAIAGDQGWVDIKASFTGVCYARTQTDLPLYLNETEIYLFGEYDARDLDILQEEEGRIYLVLPFGTSKVALPPGERHTLRYFKLGSGTLSSDWLCTDVTILIGKSEFP